mmetsp:Transcript_72337/g.162382  ORF Transcript_72337/g.162382 Transcript_72337/m.162382 type:complete len:223 (-) Transcript_72337:1362-2030(-)
MRSRGFTKILHMRYLASPPTQQMQRSRRPIGSLRRSVIRIRAVTRRISRNSTMLTRRSCSSVDPPRARKSGIKVRTSIATGTNKAATRRPSPPGSSAGPPKRRRRSVAEAKRRPARAQTWTAKGRRRATPATVLMMRARAARARRVRATVEPVLVAPKMGLPLRRRRARMARGARGPHSLRKQGKQRRRLPAMPRRPQSSLTRLPRLLRQPGETGSAAAGTP